MSGFNQLIVIAAGSRVPVVTAIHGEGLQLGPHLGDDHWNVVLKIKDGDGNERVLTVGTCFRGLGSIRPDYELVNLSVAVDCEKSVTYAAGETTVGGHHWFPLEVIKDTSNRRIQVFTCPFCATVKFQ